MKKQIIILLLAGFPILTLGQSNRATKTNGPCTNEMAQKHQGRWIKDRDLLFANKLGSQPEMMKRLDDIHKMFFELYPEPVGLDLAWHHVIRNDSFGGKVTTDKTRDGVTRHYKSQQATLLANNYYNVGFYHYVCNYPNNTEIVGGFPGESSAQLFVWINSLDNFAAITPDACMKINGYPVGMRSSVQTTWKGYDMTYNPQSTDARSVLIHRKGILPYIPVTRKQYLDHSIEHLTKIMNDAIKLQMDIPVRSLKEQEEEKKKKLEKFEKDFGKDPKRMQSAVDYYLAGYKTEQEQRDERVKKIKENSEKLLKEYHDELENSRKSGMLDSPAIVLDMHIPQPGLGGIFVNEKQGGNMLVMENPAYIRKDLPGYAPQFMVVSWHYHGYDPPEAKFIDAIMEKFPMEKLAAMIDK